MKLLTRLTPVLLPALALFIFSSMKKDPSNPPTAQTGAPGETTCSTASGCHSGGAYSGTVALTGLPGQIQPNTTYTVTITLNSTCSRTGFELTVLDKANAKCGTLAAGTGNNVKTVGTRQYVRQSNPVTMSGGKGSYSFKWTSPAAISGDSAFFYYAMLQANGNGKTSGDNANSGVTKVSMTQVSATEEQKQTSISLWPNPVSDFLTVSTEEGTRSDVALLGSDGRQISTFLHEGGDRVLDVRALRSGTYFIRISGREGIRTRSVQIVR